MKSKKLNVYILLDRSGSMSNLWDEAIGSINGYVEGLSPTTKVMLSVFDSVSYDEIRNCTVKNWVPVSTAESPPRGGTPLYDSCSKIMAKAEKDNAEKTLLVVMTDGYENSSKDVTHANIKNRMLEWDKKKWEIVFLGANFDSIGDVSASFDRGIGKSANYMPGTMVASLREFSAHTMAYASVGTAINLAEHQQKVSTEK